MATKRRKTARLPYKVPLILAPQPEGGFTVTSPLLPELVTEGDSADEALANVRDALAAVIELYEELGKPLPQNARVDDAEPLWFRNARHGAMIGRRKRSSDERPTCKRTRQRALLETATAENSQPP